MRVLDTYNLIMFIDDNETDILISTEMAKRARFAKNYITCNSAKSALAYLWRYANRLNKLPDVIFLDINMPVINGFGFLAEFDVFPQAVKEKCKVVMLSSSIDSGDLFQANQNSYVVEFINKPLHTSHLNELKRKLVLETDLHGKGN